MLFRNAAARGAETHEGMRVTEVALDAARGSRVTAEDAEGRAWSWRARFVVDASGRDTFFANRMGTQEAQRPQQHRGALRPLQGRGDARRLGGGGRLHRHPPLRARLVLVHPAPRRDHERRRGQQPRLLQAPPRQPGGSSCGEAIAMCPSAAARMRDAEPVMPAQATGNYSYRSDVMAGEGWLMVGDAFAFIDPVFSSGVCLAMASGELAADAVHTWLDDRAGRRARAPPLRAQGARRHRVAVLADLPHQRPGHARHVHERLPTASGCARAWSACWPATSTGTRTSACPCWPSRPATTACASRAASAGGRARPAWCASPHAPAAADDGGGGPHGASDRPR